MSLLKKIIQENPISSLFVQAAAGSASFMVNAIATFAQDAVDLNTVSHLLAGANAIQTIALGIVMAIFHSNKKVSAING